MVQYCVFKNGCAVQLPAVLKSSNGCAVQGCAFKGLDIF
jgi:hypothetical protein